MNFVSCKNLLLAFFLAAFSLSCTPQWGQKAEILTVNLVLDPSSLDWNQADDNASSFVLQNIMEGLVTFDLYNPQLPVIPALAERWEIKDDGYEYIFHLKSHVKWSDGLPLKAAQFVDSWQRLLDPKSGGDITYLSAIKNAVAFSQGKVGFEKVGIKALDDLTISVELEKPRKEFLVLLTHHRTWPIRKDLIQKYGPDWTSPEHIVTLGAYKLVTWKHHEEIVLERNETYYRDLAKIKTVKALMIKESLQALRDYEEGKIDVLWEIPSSQLPRLKGQLTTVALLSENYIAFSTKAKPVSNPILRRAIAMSIDRQELVKEIGGGQRPITSWIPEDVFGYESNRGMRFDPDEAKALMRRSGFSDLSRLPKIEILIGNSELNGKVAEALKNQLKHGLNLNIEVKAVDFKSFQQAIKENSPALYLMSWPSDFPSPDNFMHIFTSGAEGNSTDWRNHNYDELVDRAATEQSSELRQKYYAQAQHILVEEELPIIPLFSSSEQFLIKPNVQHFPLNRLSSKALKGAFIK